MGEVCTLVSVIKMKLTGDIWLWSLSLTPIKIHWNFLCNLISEVQINGWEDECKNIKDLFIGGGMGEGENTFNSYNACNKTGCDRHSVHM